MYLFARRQNAALTPKGKYVSLGVSMITGCSDVSYDLRLVCLTFEFFFCCFLKLEGDKSSEVP
jgi:hypothetical protein